MNQFEQEALQYDLNSLIKLQNKRIDNILLFKQSIIKEQNILDREKTIQVTLEYKIKLHESGNIILNDTEHHWILLDLPKIKSTCENRTQTIMLLKNAITEEQIAMDHERCMIAFLELYGNKK